VAHDHDVVHARSQIIRKEHAMAQQDSPPQRASARKGQVAVALPLWVLSLLAGLLLWQLFELNANMRTHNKSLLGTKNALESLNDQNFRHSNEQNKYLKQIGNNIDGLKALGK
jgi:hypothetical protein